MIRRPSFFYPHYKAPIANSIRDCRWYIAEWKYQGLIEQRRNIAGYTPRALLSLATSIDGRFPELGLSTIIDTQPSQAMEIQAIEILAGLRVEEVSAFALRMGGSVRWTRSAVSTVLEFPHECALLLGQTVLGLWRDLGYFVWQYALGPGILILLISFSCGNVRRVASLLMGIGLCWLFSGLSFPIVVLACLIIIYTLSVDRRV